MLDPLLERGLRRIVVVCSAAVFVVVSVATFLSEVSQWRMKRDSFLPDICLPWTDFCVSTDNWYVATLVNAGILAVLAAAVPWALWPAVRWTVRGFRN